MFDKTTNLIDTMETASIGKEGLTNEDVLDIVQQTKQLKLAFTGNQKLPSVY